MTLEEYSIGRSCLHPRSIAGGEAACCLLARERYAAAGSFLLARLKKQN
jgi:hypothetical protein